MNTESYQITVNDFVVDVVRKNIKNVHLAVYPPNGRVRIAVPLRVNDEAVRLFTISKIGWIKRQQAKFNQQERQATREFVSGESHYFQGNRYLLNVIYQEGTPHVNFQSKTRLDLIVRPGSSAAQREQVLTNWYRQQLKEMIPPLIAKWETEINVKVAEWGVKQMKTKWGTCNIQARRIWLNLELIKKPAHCIEYVVVHEMTHLLERKHNERFSKYMSAFLPQWRLYREELNHSPLGHEVWDY
ncbi:MAG: M48 family metallopeptidase [Chloroflexi bacterium]|uniref:M48 family metallopeptidase n=1 Tax=Candidatus Chlorohelix allophototropha TaxID=3003348 RepID=A0A8T7MAG7_9CHLR|nr:M48 family metallopeptidase [Chloroflexota bacterium]WJW70446.1 M48 family metallopeptidase [Chloroflexota bacterium L227-S17]